MSLLSRNCTLFGKYATTKLNLRQLSAHTPPLSRPAKRSLSTGLKTGRRSYSDRIGAYSKSVRYDGAQRGQASLMIIRRASAHTAANSHYSGKGGVGSNECISTGHAAQSTSALSSWQCWQCDRTLAQNREAEAASTSNTTTATITHCPDCNAIQPVPPNSTYFDILPTSHGNHPSFDVDTSQLRKAFLTMQQRVHPDAYTRKGEYERQLAEQQSAWFNHAYHTLRDPLTRAQYLLQLHDIDVSETESIADPELLMKVMEAREEIEEAQDAAQIETIANENNAWIKSTIEQLSKQFQQQNMAEAKKLTIQLKYSIWEDKHH
ncbi:hypothetical protein BDF19DRAFT_428932 [Syncephalis fuscata]|nr:hypothetical protein BDF19DRAFT_428932 [Syncephalis fuscata]